MKRFGDTGCIVGLSGAPDIVARPIGRNTVDANLMEPEVPWGAWVLLPALIGPFGPKGAPTTPVQVGKTVRGFLYIDTFNSTVETGDEVYRIPYSYTVTK